MAVHAMDALVLGGTDVQDLHFNERYQWNFPPTSQCSVYQIR